MKVKFEAPSTIYIEEDDTETAIVFDKDNLEAHFTPEDTRPWKYALERLTEDGKFYIHWSSLDDFSMRPRVFIIRKRWLFHMIIGWGYFRLSFPTRKMWAEHYISNESPEALTWIKPFIELGSYDGVQDQYREWHEGPRKFLHKAISVLRNILGMKDRDPLTSPNATWEELGRGFIEHGD